MVYYTMTMKCLFLDFDGVLNSHIYLYSDARPKDMEFLGNEHLMLDPKAVLRLNRILATTGAKVVISSSWRHGWPIERLREILAARGFVGDVIGVTADLFVEEGASRERGDEIAHWVDTHPGVERFVILDDDSDMHGVEAYFIKTTFKHGLQDEHVEEAIRRLLGVG